jgi:uncharacterized membrane protein YgdD (TMEM256/DUF423 family)
VKPGATPPSPAAAGAGVALSGCALGFLAVAAGAFGAHALRARLTPEMLAVFETAVRYQLVHAVLLVAAGLYVRGTRRSLGPAPVLIALGTTIFSGSLYVLALGGARGFGAVTPIGGLLLLAGWLTLGLKLRRPQ